MCTGILGALLCGLGLLDGHHHQIFKSSNTRKLVMTATFGDVFVSSLSLAALPHGVGKDL